MKNRTVGADSISAQKGITLIALVITIIVLLILAGITINLTLGEHGILNMAKEAGKNYQNAAEYEQGALGDFFNEAQNIINGGNGTNPADIQITLDKENIKMYVGGTYTLTTTVRPSTSNLNIIWNSSNNDIVSVVNGVVTAKAQGNATVTATIREGISANCSIEVKNPVELSDLTAGEYVYYDTGVAGIGNDGVLKCFVLYPMSSPYGLQIVSWATLPDVTLGSSDLEIAKQEYDNAIIKLNNEAMKYLNLNYALDARCIGTDPSNKEADSTPPTTIRNSSGTLVSMNYKGKTEYYKIDEQALTDSKRVINGSDFWVGSRYGLPEEYGYTFHGGFMNTGIGSNLEHRQLGLFRVNADNQTFDTTGPVTKKFVPVFKLKTDLKISGGEGSLTDPYTLGIK